MFLGRGVMSWRSLQRVNVEAVKSRGQLKRARKRGRKVKGFHRHLRSSVKGGLRRASRDDLDLAEAELYGQWGSMVFAACVAVIADRIAEATPICLIEGDGKLLDREPGEITRVALP